MNKRVLFILIFVFVLFSFTGCSNKTVNIDELNDEAFYNSKLIVLGNDLTLTENSIFFDLTYRYPDTTFVKDDGNSTTLIFNKDDGGELFKIVISKYENQPIDEVMSNKGKKNGEKAYNDILWKMYLIDGKYNSYSYYYNNSTYSITFKYNDKISAFEDEFMSSVRFN